MNQPAMPQPPMVTQGSHPGVYRLQPQAMNVAQPQQVVSDPPGYQQHRFRTPMMPRNQQFQVGNTLGSVGVGRGAPSFGSETGVSRHASSGA